MKNGSISIRKTRDKHGKVLQDLQVEKQMYRYECTNQMVLDPFLMHYFQNFPLRTTKAIALLRFQKIIRYCKTRRELPWKGKVLKRIERLLGELKE
jgi:hypothetical protein